MKRNLRILQSTSIYSSPRFFHYLLCLLYYMLVPLVIYQYFFFFFNLMLLPQTKLKTNIRRIIRNVHRDLTASTFVSLLFIPGKKEKC